MGCRNPWRISLDQRTGISTGEMSDLTRARWAAGSRGYDEINQARQAGNFGWPHFIGDNFAYSAYDFDEKQVGEPFDPARPVNRSRNNTGESELPPAQPALIYYPGARFDKFPELGSGGRTACAGPVYYAADYADQPLRMPDCFQRTLFIHEWSRNWIMAVHLDEQSQVSHIEPFLPEQAFRVRFRSSGMPAGRCSCC